MHAAHHGHPPPRAAPHTMPALARKAFNKDDRVTAGRGSNLPYRAGLLPRPAVTRVPAMGEVTAGRGRNPGPAGTQVTAGRGSNLS